VKRLLPEPLELLPERDDLTPPQFAVEGLTPLQTDAHFKSLEEVFDMSSTQATTVMNPELPLDKLFNNTIY